MEARRVSVWGARYDLLADGERVATWEQAGWRPGGTLELDGRRYLLRSDPAGRTCSLVGSGGRQIASADQVGRRDWTIRAGETTYRFRRAAPWRQKEDVLVDGQRVGSLRRRTPWRGRPVSDLPGVPLDVEVFALAVVLMQWSAQAR
jgi:hypothetical protein